MSVVNALASVLGVFTTEAATRLLRDRLWKFSSYLYDDASGWQHLGFSSDASERARQVERFVAESRWKKQYFSTGEYYEKVLDPSGNIGVLFGSELGEAESLRQPLYEARNRNVIAITGSLPFHHEFMRGVGRFAEIAELDSTLMLAELLAYRVVKGRSSEIVAIVAFSFYPSYLRVYRPGQRPSTFAFRVPIPSCDGVQPLFTSEQPTLQSLAHPNLHGAEQLAAAALVGSVIDSGAHFNAAAGSTFYHATVNAGRVVVDLVLDGSRLQAPLEVGSFVAGHGRLLAEVVGE